MILQVANLSKDYGGIRAVRDASFAVADNAIHALIGPNGAGKTTLLSMLAGAVKPNRGRIQFCGDDITDLPCRRRARLGLVRSFQVTNVVLQMTLLENVQLAVQAADGHCFRFWRAVADDAAMHSRAMQYLAAVDLQARADVLASEAAHGEQRRLELAMALALRPKMLLLDEPMAGLSAAEAAAMIALLAGLREEVAVLLVEHDMQAVFALADVVSVLVDGVIIASGDAAEIRGNAEVQRAYLGEE